MRVPIGSAEVCWTAEIHNCVYIMVPVEFKISVTFNQKIGVRPSKQNP